MLRQLIPWNRQIYIFQIMLSGTKYGYIVIFFFSVLHEFLFLKNQLTKIEKLFRMEEKFMIYDLQFTNKKA